MKKAEQQGELEETSMQMDKKAPPPTTERIPATLRLGPIFDGEAGHEAAPKKKLGRPPASQRLGPSNPKKKVSTEEGTGAKPTERKKLGRPPSKRVVQQSPKLIRGSSSLKRKGQKDNTPHCRKKLITSGSRATN
ncbi:unnamed protein product [Brassica oleracea var. botrytis]|uniref:Uncharacterized protein n=1 Tax=Brassica oleracea TaxID=3712 RepID=A0A3P6CYK7_BRAOL|nr:unnamed protein product [Brassica oleracea]